MTSTPSADVEELLASIPSVLLIPAGRLSVEESDAIIALYAKAVGASVPTPEQLDAERSARAETTPQRGEQGRDQARRRFGSTSSSSATGDQGRAMAAKRFGAGATDQHAASLDLARARAGQ